MSKPLLTDEIIERANRGEKISAPPLLDDEETKILPTSSSRFGYANPKDHGFSQETLKIQVEPSIHKSRQSRRIENTKRNVFNSKLNKILFAVIFLLILLVLAMKLL